MKKDIHDFEDEINIEVVLFDLEEDHDEQVRNYKNHKNQQEK